MRRSRSNKISEKKKSFRPRRGRGREAGLRDRRRGGGEKGACIGKATGCERGCEGVVHGRGGRGGRGKAKEVEGNIRVEMDTTEDCIEEGRGE